MNFGAFFLATSAESEDPKVVYDRASEYIVSAETLNFDSLWFAEHHFSNYGYIPNPLLMATKAATLTDSIRIGTAVLVLPFWNPLRVAEDIALTDHLTDGRLEVGVARGYQPFEFKRFGLTLDDARERTDETLEILLMALTQQTFSWQGNYFDIPETTILPAPKQQPTPPIWLAAHSQESFDIAAKFGLNAFTTTSGQTIDTLVEVWSNYQDALERYPSAPKMLGVQAQVCVMDSDEIAQEQMTHFRYQNRQARTLKSGNEQVISGVSTPLAYEDEPELEELFTDRTLSGSPDTVIKKIKTFQSVAEIDQINCVFHFGAMDPKLSSQSMKLFAEEVAPEFR